MTTKEYSHDVRLFVRRAQVRQDISDALVLLMRIWNRSGWLGESVASATDGELEDTIGPAVNDLVDALFDRGVLRSDGG